MQFNEFSERSFLKISDRSKEVQAYLSQQTGRPPSPIVSTADGYIILQLGNLVNLAKQIHKIMNEKNDKLNTCWS